MCWRAVCCVLFVVRCLLLRVASCLSVENYVVCVVMSVVVVLVVVWCCYVCYVVSLCVV